MATTQKGAEKTLGQSSEQFLQRLPAGWDKNSEWKQFLTEPELSPANLVINAWIAGTKKIEEERKNRFNSNLENAQKAGNTLINKILEMGFNFEVVYLRPRSISQFELLVVVPIDVYYDPKFLNLISESNKLTKKSIEEGGYLYFSFMPFSDQLDENILKSDRYFLKYVKR